MLFIRAFLFTAASLLLISAGKVIYNFFPLPTEYFPLSISIFIGLSLAIGYKIYEEY